MILKRIRVEMALAGVRKITLVNRSEERGRALEELFRGKLNERVGGDLEVNYVPWDGIYELEPDTDIVVNATSIGLFPDVEAQVPLAVESLRPEMVVADVIPNPPTTRLVRDAREAGCQVIDGLGMLVAQGVIGVEYWTGRTPDASVMRQGLEEVFASVES